MSHLESFGRNIALITALAGGCATPAIKQLGVEKPGATPSGEVVACAPNGTDEGNAREDAILRAQALAASEICRKKRVEVAFRVLDGSRDDKVYCVKIGNVVCTE
jgi:hypothetical protein